ncbi:MULTISPECIES: FAD-binding oxidoreductase [Streptomyces]|uniref:FAD-binding oxidoreductase n=1 Tax=Streptomyces cadmiisoli TaxID=2184053 RepID=A0A2Z4IXH8_9ACTN|nr:MULTISPECIES: FAD-dependent oxidoreductase [Streptomyces]AWW37582.1 FAD-binding oxidoreductase [Streptomyces cadmiisoli]
MTIENEASALAGVLADSVAGPVLLPDDSGFTEELASFQLGLRHQPDLVVGARDAADVRTVLRLAGEHGVPVTVHNTGHGMRFAANEGVVVTLRRMNGVLIDPVARTARVGGGATWNDVLAAAAPHGLVPPSGSLGCVGAVGYTLGGGISLLARSDGWASDLVRSFTVVTDEGEEREVGPRDAEWFAHLRGSGPMRGEVVTGMTVGLLSEGPLQGGGLTFDIGATGSKGDPAVLHAFQEWTADLPEELTSTLRVMSFPDLDYLPPMLRGRRIARVAVALRGSREEADRLVAPLRRVAPPIEDTLAPMPFAEYERVHAEPDNPGPYIGENLLVDALDTTALENLARLDGPTMVIVNIRHLGGALARPATVPDTVQGRDARYLVAAVAPVDPCVSVTHPAAAHDQANPGWALEPFGTAAVGVSPGFTVGPRGRS